MAQDEGKAWINLFDGKDFACWKVQIEDHMYRKNLHQPMLGKKPEKMTNEEWELLDRKALGEIRAALSRNVMFNVIKEKTTISCLKALSNMYEKPSAANKVYLMRRLFNLKMMEGSSVTTHINELNSILTQLSSVSIAFDDEIQALILLSSLPDSWGPTVTAVSSSGGSKSLKFSEVRDLILSEDVRRRESGEVTSSALSMESRGRNGNRGSKNHGRSKSKGRGKSKPRKEADCWNCGNKGHYKRDCPDLIKDKNQRRENQQVNVATDDYADALVCCVDSPVDQWVLDSGASFHSTPCVEYLNNYVTGNFGKVYLADDQPLDIVGKGEVNLRTTHGMQLKLHDVRHVPGLKKNLISMGQIDNNGYTTVFGGGLWKIIKGNLVVARGVKAGTLYTTEITKDSVAAVESVEDPKLWHRRLGHMSEKGMKILASKGKLPIAKTVDLGLCEDCVLGKQKKVSFSKGGREPKAEKLELVHTDVWGPAPVQSLGGSRYYVTFIDDSTRKVWVYFLKNKSDVFVTFKRWKAEVENETGLKLKSLRSDNGGEYDSLEFKDYCAESGIKMIKTIPGTPQQNGIAERMNRTLNERARSMRITSGLPKSLWADAVSTAAYLINRGPSVPLDFKIPEEVWSGKEVTLAHLRTFGCLSYVLVNAENRDKLDPKAQKCFFIGYGGENFGYRFWDEQNKKIIRHKDVTFNEKVLYKDKLDVDSGSMEKEEASKVVELDSTEVELVPGEIVEEEPKTPKTAVRRSTRNRQPPKRYSPSLHYLLLTEAGDPECFSEAMGMGDSVKWENAMREEMDSLDKNETWVLTKLPKYATALQNKWVFRVKEEPDGMKRYKARLVVKGFLQKEGIDYKEIFSPVVKLTTIRIVLSIVAAEDLHLEQLDVKTAFLHGDLEEEIYMDQPEGFLVPGKENLKCKLVKSLYGLKQAPRQWNIKFDNFMGSNGFTRCNMDHCCYFKDFGESYIILLLYVDDMLVAGSSMMEIDKLKQQLSNEFEMKDLGAANTILGMRIIRNRSSGSLKLSQEKYIEKVLARFAIHKAKSRSTPLASNCKLSRDQSPKLMEERKEMAKVPYSSAIGSLMYAMVCTRPDIAQAVAVVSRYMSDPGIKHWEAVKWLMRYLRGTSSMGLCFTKSNITLEGFVDADLGGDLDSRKSTTGYVFTLGGTAISWMSKLQSCVALSTTEAEYMATSEAGKEMVWLKNFLKEIGKEQRDCVLYSDSQSAICLAKNPVYHSRTKHIELRYHYIRQLLEDGILDLRKILGAKNPADMLTKGVTTDKLRLCIALVGLLVL